MLAITASPLVTTDWMATDPSLPAPGLALTLLSMPWVSLILAALIAIGISVSPRWRARAANRARLATTTSDRVSARYSPEHRALGVVALTMIAVVITESLVSGYAVNLNGVVSWWRYALPVFIAGVGVAVLIALIATRGTSSPERPVVSARRTWLTFTSPFASACTAASILALTATTFLAGLASSNIDGGPYVFLEIDVPNATIDPIRPWFYGWAYGVPVLVCTAALVAVVVAAMHASAARPFLRAETVLAEQHERRDIATGITRVATSGALLALAGAWRFIAEAGSGTTLTIQGDDGNASYEAFWRYGEVAAVGGWLAPAIEIAAFVLLLLVSAQLCPPGHDAEPADAAELSIDRETAQ
ncbi:hypothetical protein ABRP18_016035 [Microbacterium sp. WHRI 7836]|uniref:hypothetical protein n=1 Tax=Microbacterium sp. WHRI 7836 TaxID=3162563 RepID=UPI0032EB561D